MINHECAPQEEQPTNESTWVYMDPTFGLMRRGDVPPIEENEGWDGID